MREAIDVSTIQGKIDWQAVSMRGISCAMIKASQGRSETNAAIRDFSDSRFIENAKGAYAAGISVGAYHYLTAQTVAEAREEAKVFLAVMSPVRALVTLWAAVDVESKYLPDDAKMLTRIVAAFCDTVKAGGYQPCVYTNPDFLAHRLMDISRYPLWLAAWRSNSAQWATPQEIYALEKAALYPQAVAWQWGAYKAGIICPAECDGDFVFSAEDREGKISAGDKVRLTSDAVYTSGAKVPLWVRALPVYVRYVNGETVGFSVLSSGAITGYVNKKYIK